MLCKCALVAIGRLRVRHCLTLLLSLFFFSLCNGLPFRRRPSASISTETSCAGRRPSVPLLCFTTLSSALQSPPTSLHSTHVQHLHRVLSLRLALHEHVQHGSTSNLPKGRGGKANHQSKGTVKKEEATPPSAKESEREREEVSFVPFPAPLPVPHLLANLG